MITACRHYRDGEGPRPCPPMCPSQSWPTRLFRLTSKGWKLRQKYRPYLDQWVAYRVAWRAYADQFPNGHYLGTGRPNPPPAVPQVPA